MRQSNLLKQSFEKNENQLQTESISKMKLLIQEPLWLRSTRINIILDLDMTLLYSTKSDTDFEQHMTKFAPDLKSSICRFKISEVPSVICFSKRPFLNEFLTEIKPFSHIYVYTNGMKSYAENLCKFIDPSNSIFEVIKSRANSEGSAKKSSSNSEGAPKKSLLSMIKYNIENTIIIDDQVDAWAKSDYSYVLDSISYIPFKGSLTKSKQTFYYKYGAKNEGISYLTMQDFHILEGHSKESSQLYVLADFIRSMYVEFTFKNNTTLHDIYRHRVSRILKGKQFDFHSDLSDENMQTPIKHIIRNMGGEITSGKEDAKYILSKKNKGSILFSYPVHCFFYKCCLPIDKYVIV